MNSPEKDSKACGYYHSAIIRIEMGPAHYSEATRLLTVVVTDYPETVYASMAKKCLNGMSSKVLNQVM